MIRSVAFLLLILVLPGSALALGLGKLELKSRLNEPFEAHIPLLSVTADELDSLKVNLAGLEEFRRAGLERPFELTKLKFQLKESANKDYILITSQDSIREPFLNFLVEINWNRGRLLREYTTLLDPPTYAPIVQPEPSAPPAQSIPVVPKQSSSPAPAPAQTYEPRPSGTLDSLNPPPKFIDQSGHDVVYNLDYKQSITPGTTSAPQPQSYQPVYTGGDHTTVRGDTLWELASQMRPDSTVSIQQTMLAMYRANPDAFVDNNINNLKTGQVLSSPELSDIRTLSKSDAIAQVQEHNNLWQGFKQAMADSVAERPDSAGVSLPVEDDSASQMSESATVEDEPELELVGSSDSSSGVGQGIGETGSDSAVMSDDMVLAEESLIALESENKELKEKLIEAESIIDDLNRLIVLKEDEIAALRDQLAPGMEPGMERRICR